MPAKFFFRQPSEKSIRAFLERQEGAPFSYAEVGRTAQGAPEGYLPIRRRGRIGAGGPAFEAACAAVRAWKMFEVPGVRLCWPQAPIAAGSTVAVAASCPGFWCLNACRIVYVVGEDGETKRFGFAYGTLPDHVEIGEERFLVEMLPDGSVWYDLFSFSRPGHWLARAAAPLARRLQKRFADESLNVMSRS